MTTSKLTKSDQKLFRGTAAEVHSFMSNEDILKSIGCNFDVTRVPHEYKGKTFNEVQHWHRSDNDGLLGTFGSRRKCIQPEVFVDYFRNFCEASNKEISLDLVGSFDAGKTFYMASKLTQIQNNNFDKVGDKTDSWLVVTDYYGESRAPKVMVLFNELICTNGMTRQIKERHNAFNHLREMTFDDVAPVLESAVRESQAYSDMKDKFINTEIKLKRAKDAVQKFFDDEKLEQLRTKTVHNILDGGLIGGNLTSRQGNVWGLVSAMTQYTSHNRTQAEDVKDEKTFKSQIDGSRAYMNKRFIDFLESEMLVTA
jgi:hypothetical protein